ncbi:hypothetical protein [Dehalogenimonas etheniformans]|uniref:Uncharacterized protein n=1 Tax=Dehalogenimonas etheniformans TaxID=1536648 RepID=A0A2P5P512_9CHLR|nr:hypothetical protein [Dehalogenimonas etheniformans]PPD57376.1 hypothetical protein JP09_010080 [Dehalogenimonas etheniformans]QNT75227.1 hypothetical protein HX448_00225 [Dehalogenimonas etheniformans]
MANKFSEQLEKIIRGGSRPLGFGQYAAPAKPRLFVLAEAQTMDNGIKLKGIDAVLVPGPCKCPAKKSEILMGCSIRENIEHKGCDFVVLDLEGAIVGIEENTARVLQIGGDLTDAQLRALGGLDAAALIADAGLGDSLIFRDLLAVQRLVDFYGKTLLLRLPKIYGKAEMQALSDRGIAGVVVDGAKIDTAALRKAIEELEPKKKGKEKSTAIVNCPPPAAHTEETEPEIEPDEDE